jgi:hypothetical protein
MAVFGRVRADNNDDSAWRHRAEGRTNPVLKSFEHFSCREKAREEAKPVGVQTVMPALVFVDPPPCEGLACVVLVGDLSDSCPQRSCTTCVGIEPFEVLPLGPERA